MPVSTHNCFLSKLVKTKYQTYPIIQLFDPKHVSVIYLPIGLALLNMFDMQCPEVSKYLLS